MAELASCGENLSEYKRTIEGLIDETISLNHELKEYPVEQVDIPAWFICTAIQRHNDTYTLDDVEYKVVSVERLLNNRVKIIIEDVLYKFRFSAVVVYNVAGVFAEEDWNPNGPVDKWMLLDSYTIPFKKAYNVCLFKVTNMTEEEFSKMRAKQND